MASRHSSVCSIATATLVICMHPGSKSAAPQLWISYSRIVLVVHADALQWAPVQPQAAASEAAKLYSNRALALLKVGGTGAARTAQQDCTAALQLEPSNLKVRQCTCCS